VLETEYLARPRKIPEAKLPEELDRKRNSNAGCWKGFRENFKQID
jgi:hypothetical protein